MSASAPSSSSSSSAESSQHQQPQQPNKLQQHYAGPMNAPAGVDLPPGVQWAAAAERNKADIAQAIQPYWQGARTMLELSSGTGQHMAHFAAVLPSAAADAAAAGEAGSAAVFQPSDMSQAGFASIAFHCRDQANVRPPIVIDVVQHEEAEKNLQRVGLLHACDVLFVANMLHISSVGTTEGLFRVAAAALRPPPSSSSSSSSSSSPQDNKAAAGRLLVYGPFKRDGKCTTESNRMFDEKLKTMSPEFGYRDIADVAAVGQRWGFTLLETRDMPANNFFLAFTFQGKPNNNNL